MVLIAEAYPNVLQAIGLATVRWSSVDSLMAEILSEEMEPKIAFEKIFKRQGAGRKRFQLFLTEVVRTSIPVEETQKMTAAVEGLMDLYEARNSITHSPYAFSIFQRDDNGLEGELERIEYRADAEGKKVSKSSASDIKAHADRVHELSEPLRAWRYRHQRARAPNPSLLKPFP